jgi:WD40 repeat protein/class 3 adenylate cyclase/energy-coupling factor transporter ATP-binding protein EcfA2
VFDHPFPSGCARAILLAMRQLPSGTVTFLFTDIEGSTRLLHALGERYAQALMDHRRLLRAAFARHGGVEVDTQGDSFFVAFGQPDAGLAAAEGAQRALAGHAWPDDTALRVRMGLHTGEPILVDGHYVGIDVHRAARIAAAAHGGQVIVSERTNELLPGDGALRDLGEHHLKDLPDAERLFQLVADGLPSSFPPLRVHEETVEAAGLPDYTLPPADVPCPYKGLLPFEPEDSELFFGRERLAQNLAARLRESSFLAVVGPSGSGKSSLVRAGIVPAIRPASGDEARIALFSPGSHPAAQLAEAGEATLIVVDQFEEAFTLCRDLDERNEFIDGLLDAAGRGIPVVVALRADFYGHCAAYPRLASALEEHQALVGPMSEEELRRAIERPAEHAGLLLEPGVVEGILRDVVGQPGALPLLSHSLLETWKRRSGRMLTLIGYLQAGGVHGAIAQTAEAVYRDALSPEQQALARNVFLRLTELGEGTEDTRRRVSIAELVPRPEQEAAVRELLRTLADARLVTVGERTVEVAHEALIRHWPTLRDWLDEDREGRLLHRRLTEAALEWEALGRDAGALFRGTRLATTGDWATAHDPELNQLERGFLTASRQASEREADRQRRANRRLRALLVGIATFLVVALIAAFLALVQRSRARSAQSDAEAQALRSDAERLSTLALTDPHLDRSLLLAVAGVELQDLPETRGDLLFVLQKTPALIRVAALSRADVPALAANPGGRLLASGDAAGVVRFTDVRTWRMRGAAVWLDGAVSQNGMELSPDGRTLAVATTRGQDRANLYLIDVAARRSRLVGSWDSVPAVAGPRRFTRMAFSPDGRRLAVAVATAPRPSPVPLGQRLLLLSVPSGRLVWERRYPLRPGQNETSVAFTHQGALVTSAQQGETLLWDAATGVIRRRFPVGGPFAVSPDGSRLALAQNNPDPSVPRASLAVLDLRTGEHRSLQALPVPGWIVSLRFTRDGANLVGRSTDSAVREWNVATGSITQTFAGQGSGLNEALTDGRTVVSTSQNGTLAAWDLSGAQRLGRTFRWRSPQADCPATPCFVVGRRGSLMAESLADGRIGLVDLRARRLLDTLPARNGPVVDDLAFLPNGTLATAGANGKIIFWDVRKRAVVRTLRAEGHVWRLAPSPDGKLLALQTRAQGQSASRVEVRDLRSGTVLYRRPVPNGTGGVDFSPDGRRLAALGCCDPASTIKVWAARSGAELYSPHVGGLATSIAFSPDGHVLAAGTEDGKVLLRDAHDGSPLGSPIQVATGPIDPISFSPAGRLFVASSGDQTTTLWDVGSRKRLGTPFAIEPGSVPVSRFTPAGDLVIDNLVDTAVWPTDLRSWQRFACRVAGRNLTRREWSDLLPDRPYRRVCPP